MKKLSILALLLALIVVIGCACNNGGSGSDTSAAPGDATDPATDAPTDPPATEAPGPDPLNAVMMIDSENEDTYVATGNTCIPYNAAVEKIDLNANLEKGALSLWLYIADVAAVKDPVSVELCTGTAADIGEFCYEIPVADLVSGWYHYVISFADFNGGTTSDDSVPADWTNINFVRIFTLANDGAEATMKVGRLGVYNKRTRAESDFYAPAFKLYTLYYNENAETATLSGVNGVLLTDVHDMSAYYTEGIKVGSWIYIEDVSKFPGAGAQLEFTSKGEFDDTNEISWVQNETNCADGIKAGWNLLTFDFIGASISGEADYSAINFFRSYVDAGAGPHKVGAIVFGTEADVLAYRPAFLGTAETEPPAEG